MEINEIIWVDESPVLALLFNMAWVMILFLGGVCLTLRVSRLALALKLQVVH